MRLARRIILALAVFSAGSGFVFVGCEQRTSSEVLKSSERFVYSPDMTGLKQALSDKSIKYESGAGQDRVIVHENDMPVIRKMVKDDQIKSAYFSYSGNPDYVCIGAFWGSAEEKDSVNKCAEKNGIELSYESLTVCDVLVPRDTYANAVDVLRKAILTGEVATERIKIY